MRYTAAASEEASSLGSTRDSVVCPRNAASVQAVIALSGLAVVLSSTGFWSGMPLAAIAVAVLVFVSIFPILQAIFARRWDPFDGVSVITYSTLAFYTLPALDLAVILPITGVRLDPRFYRNYSQEANPLLDKELAVAILVASVGVLVAWAGYFSSRGRRASHSRVARRYSAPSLLLGASLLTFIGLVGFAAEVQAAGGWASWSSAHWARRLAGRPSDAVLLLVSAKLLLIPAALLAYWVAFLRAGNRPTLRTIGALLAGIAVVVLGVTGTRKNVLWIMLGALVLRHYLRRRVNVVQFVGVVLLLVVLLMFLSPLRSVWRLDDPGGSLIAAWSIIRSVPFTSFVRGTTDASIEFDAYVSTITAVPRQMGPLWGATYLRLAFAFVPKSVWAEKPDTAGGYVTKELYSHTGAVLSSTVIGEAWLNFLLPGVVGVMFWVGWGVRRLEQGLAFSRGDESGALLWAVLVPMILELYRSDSFVLFFYLIELGPLLMILRPYSMARRG